LNRSKLNVLSSQLTSRPTREELIEKHIIIPSPPLGNSAELKPLPPPSQLKQQRTEISLSDVILPTTSSLTSSDPTFILDALPRDEDDDSDGVTDLLLQLIGEGEDAPHARGRGRANPIAGGDVITYPRRAQSEKRPKKPKSKGWLSSRGRKEGKKGDSFTSTTTPSRLPQLHNVNNKRTTTTSTPPTTSKGKKLFTAGSQHNIILPLDSTGYHEYHGEKYYGKGATSASSPDSNKKSQQAKARFHGGKRTHQGKTSTTSPNKGGEAGRGKKKRKTLSIRAGAVLRDHLIGKNRNLFRAADDQSEDSSSSNKEEIKNEKKPRKEKRARAKRRKKSKDTRKEEEKKKTIKLATSLMASPAKQEGSGKKKYFSYYDFDYGANYADFDFAFSFEERPDEFVAWATVPEFFEEGVEGGGLMEDMMQLMGESQGESPTDRYAYDPADYMPGGGGGGSGNNFLFMEVVREPMMSSSPVEPQLDQWDIYQDIYCNEGGGGLRFPSKGKRKGGGGGVQCSGEDVGGVVGSSTTSSEKIRGSGGGRDLKTSKEKMAEKKIQGEKEKKEKRKEKARVTIFVQDEDSPGFVMDEDLEERDDAKLNRSDEQEDEQDSPKEKEKEKTRKKEGKEKGKEKKSPKESKWRRQSAESSTSPSSREDKKSKNKSDLPLREKKKRPARKSEDSNRVTSPRLSSTTTTPTSSSSGKGKGKTTRKTEGRGTQNNNNNAKKEDEAEDGGEVQPTWRRKSSGM